MKKIGVLGSGIVGQVLANGFQKHGYQVMLGSNNSTKLVEIKSKLHTEVKTGTFDEATIFGDIIVLAVKGNAAESVIAAYASKLSGKVIIDTTNPIGDLPPVNGVIQYFTDINNDSLMERLQKLVPDAYFVKAFNSIGNAFMVNPDFNGQKPTMFICGNSTEAKNEIREILVQFGFEVEDMGMVESARAIEPLCILWCLPGFLGNRWSHAFKLLTK